MTHLILTNTPVCARLRDWMAESNKMYSKKLRAVQPSVYGRKMGKGYIRNEDIVGQYNTSHKRLLQKLKRVRLHHIYQLCQHERSKLISKCDLFVQPQKLELKPWKIVSMNWVPIVIVSKLAQSWCRWFLGEKASCYLFNFGRRKAAFATMSIPLHNNHASTLLFLFV